ncbi:MFS transporter [Actinokineospora bangkokensis]|uniref:MFS transporter n=2 Tax=Actinokineospora bangkokensis TaxID=1193682 RepID=A0A1Q9LES5_9PSEU|nr:MFS transporter [Actinokineospora bangkokensis]
MVMLDATVVTVAIPAVLADLGATLNEVIWVNSAYLLANTVPLLVTGRLGDRFGPKRVLVVGLVVFLAASLWCALSPTPASLIAARAVQGLGAAAMTPQTLSFISALFPPERRRAPIAVWGAVAGVATITGPVIGGLLVQHLGWPSIFFLNLPIGLAGLVLGLRLLPDPRGRRAVTFDTTGAVLAAAGLALLVFGVQNGQHFRWSPLVLACIGAGLVLLVVFAIGQRGPDRLIPRRLFADRAFGFANLVHAALGFATTAMFLPLVIYAQSVLGLDPVRSALLCLPMAAAAGAGALIAGRVRWDPRLLITSGLGLLMAGTVALAVAATPGTAPLELIPGTAVAGFGMGLVFSPLTATATTALPPDLVGAGSGVFNTARQVGGVLGSSATGVLLQVGLSVSVPKAAAEYAKFLPPRFADEFVERVSAAAAAAGEFSAGGPQVPAEWSPSIAEKVRELARAAFDLGFTNAARAALVLPVVVLVLGVIAAFGLPKAPRPARAPAAGTPVRQPAP